MSDEVSDNLTLPFLQPSQAQKHVTHNEALERLDILVQLTVEALDATTPPSLPKAGEVHALGTGAREAWAGHDGELAAWVGEAWVFIVPREGWRAWSRADAILCVWDGADWVQPGLEDIESLGINATSDDTNRLSVAAAGTLLSHEGDDHRLVINKATPADTATILYQSDFSGRAEMGLSGENDFSFKVSPDGASWLDALRIDASDARVTVAAMSAESIAGAAVTQSDVDTTGGRLLKVGDFGIGAIPAPMAGDLNALTAGGLYRYDVSSGSSNSPTRSDGDGNSAHARGGVIQISGRSAEDRDRQIFISEQWPFRGELYTRARDGNDWPDDVGPEGTTDSTGWQRHWSTVNTTVDSNGFIKHASPIVRVMRDGHEEPVQPVGATWARLDVGHYTLADVEPLATRGWQRETPMDGNGNRMVVVRTDYDAQARVMTVRTHEPVWREGKLVAGACRDIPEGRWVDLRFEAAPE